LVRQDAVSGRQRIIFDDARFIGNIGWNFESHEIS